MGPCRSLYGYTLAAMVSAGVPSGSLAAGDERAGWGDPCRPMDVARSTAIEEMYQRRDRVPVWLTRSGTTPSGRRLLRVLDTSGAGVVTDCLETALNGRDGGYSRGQLDVMLTDAYLVLAQRRLGKGAGFRDFLDALRPGTQEHRRRYLDRLAGDTGAPDRSPAAGDSETGRMAAALERYRRIADRGGWPRIGAGAVLVPGDGDPRVPALRRRLAASGDLPRGARERGGALYGGALVDAVKAFQRRHGLEPSGVVGPETRRALDVPARERVRQLAANLRRIERHVIDSPDPVVRVNIPDFRLTILERGRVTFSTRAIVGRPDRATPQLQTRITALTLNPPWHVPRKIVREELAERFARDPGYAERHGFRAANGGVRLAELDWRDAPMVAVRQDPGPSNALGRIKFEMPNRRAIYLHDTPRRHLFESRRRAFSAGCVRVEDPMMLAARLTGIERGRLERMARSGETRTIGLGWRIPVQLVYLTAWVDSGGRVQFRPDVYNLDAGELRASAQSG